jgi:opacity protein-like surface antigen
MRQLVVAVLALIPLWSAAQASADPATASPQPGPTPASQPSRPQPLAIEPAAGPSSPLPVTAAATGADRSYLFARIGTIVPRSSDLRGFENGIAVEAGAGTRLTRYLAVEIETGYLRTTEGTSSADASGGAYHLSQELTAVPLAATVRLFGRALGFEGYVLGGAGMYLWAYGGKETWSDSPPSSFSGSDTGFGLHVGAGLSASLTRQVTLGLEGRYLFANGTFFGRTSDLGSAIVTASFGYAF